MKMDFLENWPRPDCVGLGPRDVCGLWAWALDGLFLRLSMLGSYCAVFFLVGFLWLLLGLLGYWACWAAVGLA
jgi:hypothetical protein